MTSITDKLTRIIRHLTTVLNVEKPARGAAVEALKVVQTKVGRKAE